MVIWTRLFGHHLIVISENVFHNKWKEDIMCAEITAHIVFHSHWDREWYTPVEEHRYHWIQLMDDVMEIFGADPHFHSFFMDGHGVMIEDYLTVRPDRRETVEQYLKERRLVIEPWFVLKDTFLTSSEANIRKLFYGMACSHGQATQILKQAKGDVAIIEPGVMSTGFNNQVLHDEYGFPYSGLYCAVPRNPKVLGILFANWHSNSNEVPVSVEKAKHYWSQKLHASKRFVLTTHLLYMNGCDHQPVQKYLNSVIETAKKSDDLKAFKEELRNQTIDSRTTLVNTTVAGLYLKQMNDCCQRMLESVVEPLGILKGYSEQYQDYTAFLWQEFMKNHFHNNICEYSIDQVHQEIIPRLKRVEKVAQKLVKETMKDLASQMDTTHSNPEAIPLILFNTLGEAVETVLTQKIHMHKTYLSNMEDQQIIDYLNKQPLPMYEIQRANGTVLPCHVKALGVVSGYDWVKDKFRKPYYAKEVELSFYGEWSYQLGYECCHLVPLESDVEPEHISMWHKELKQLENEYLKVTINRDGRYTLENKETRTVYPGLGMYEDTGDIGNAYVYKQPEDQLVIKSCEKVSAIKLVEDTPYTATVCITTIMEVPIRAEVQLKDECKQAKRSDHKIGITIETYLTLRHKSKGVEIKVNFENKARDHRIQVLFPLKNSARYHYADSVFQIVKRPNQPEEQWVTLGNDWHMQRFVSLNGKNGLTVVTKGLNEYEIINGKTIAVTMLRCFGEVGGGLTSEGQCFGEHQCELLLIPHEKDVISSQVYQEAYQYSKKPLILHSEQHPGDPLTCVNALYWKGDGAVLTAMKQGGNNNWIIRWFNPKSSEVSLTVMVKENQSIYESTILEHQGAFLAKGKVCLTINPNEIKTILIEA